MENFILLTKEGDKTRNFVYGAAENLGRLLYSLYINSWRFDESGMRGVLEVVAEDIRGARDGRIGGSAKAARRVM